MAREREIKKSRPIDRGYVRMRLIRDIADENQTDPELGKKYGCSHTAISQFRRRWAEEIAAVKASVEGEFTALWIADKENRIAEYQQAAEDIDVALDAVAGQGMTKDDVALLAEKRKIMRGVSEELGQLPPRNNNTVQGATIIYQYDGINPSDVT